MIAIIEGKDHFAVRQATALFSAVKNHIFHFCAAQLLGALFAQNPTNRIGYIALPAAVRADNARHALVEAHLDAVRKRFKAVNFQFL